MAKSRKAKTQQDLPYKELWDFLAKTCGAQPKVIAYGSAKRRIEVATLNDYPKSGLTTFVTMGCSELPASSYRGLAEGFELTLTLAKADPHIPEELAALVLENQRIAKSDERRPFIEFNGVFAAGYAPHFLFTDQATCTPKISGRTRIGVRYFWFLAAIPVSDAELTDYDHSVPKLIAKLKREKRMATYPRR